MRDDEIRQMTVPLAVGSNLAKGLAEQAKPSALVIDDEPIVQEVLARGLQKLGLVVSTAGTGREALASLRQAPLELVVLDLLLPDMHGIEVLLELETLHRRPKAIVISGATGGYDVLDVAERVGAIRTLRKPFGIDDFLEAVREVLDEKPATRGSEDRRVHQRFPAKLPVEFVGTHTEGCGVITNLSLGGCTIVSPTAPRPDECLLLHVDVPWLLLPLQIDVTMVRWICGARFGVEFLQASQGQREVVREILARIVM